MRQLFQYTSWFEAASYLSLLAAVLIYRVFDGPRLITPVGWIHGIAFMVYVAVALAAARAFMWSLRQSALALLASVIPILGFFVPHQLLPATVISRQIMHEMQSSD